LAPRLLPYSISRLAELSDTYKLVAGGRSGFWEIPAMRKRITPQYSIGHLLCSPGPSAREFSGKTRRRSGAGITRAADSLVATPCSQSPDSQCPDSQCPGSAGSLCRRFLKCLAESRQSSTLASRRLRAALASDVGQVANVANLLPIGNRHAARATVAASRSFALRDFPSD
jgi:hypothetical protein